MDLEKFYTRVFDWIIIFGPRLLLGLIVLFLGLWIVKVITKWISGRMHKRNVDATAKPFLISLLGVVLRILLILAVMQILGMEMTLFTALVGAFGVAAGLALSGTLQNFASGIIILLVKPFSVGDNIITQGLEGTVTSIRIFHTLVTTFDNRSVIVPNSKLSNEVIINISREGTRRLDIEIKFTNAVDIGTVRKIINAAIDKCTNILSSPERRIGVVSIENDGYKLGINVWVNAHGFQDTKLAIQEMIVEDLKKSEIKLPGL
ncbi:mechanosensitive ion channel family protein [Pedobacter namyangjuensis]|uniref:mechanosensitive ion channel family protein n=1 Tax=Pedobacter namyangjuensis TaxID=600626 RepID=UPI000DE44BAF|nr:mechanosensitive ion channel family protein [Pedobacter namyangjuensis]